MRHILVVNAKGGSGKTTVATNLASYYASEGKDVVLADYDPQGSSLDWLKARSSARPPIKGVSGDKTSAKPSRNTEVVVIDSPAAIHGSDLTKMVRKAESILIPVLPSPVDMRAAENFIREIRSCAPVEKKKAKLALIANRSRDYTKIYWELDEFLQKQRIPFLTMLRDNQNYIRAAERGLGVFELPPYASAIDREQWEPVIKWLKSKRSRP